MTAEDKCNRCEQFGPNGLTMFPCQRVPSRHCPWFIKIPEKKYKKIIAERVKRIKESGEARKRMLQDPELVEQVKENTKKLLR